MHLSRLEHRNFQKSGSFYAWLYHSLNSVVYEVFEWLAKAQIRLWKCCWPCQILCLCTVVWLYLSHWPFKQAFLSVWDCQNSQAQIDDLLVLKAFYLLKIEHLYVFVNNNAPYQTAQMCSLICGKIVHVSVCQTDKLRLVTSWPYKLFICCKSRVYRYLWTIMCSLIWGKIVHVGVLWHFCVAQFILLLITKRWLFFKLSV